MDSLAYYLGTLFYKFMHFIGAYSLTTNDVRPAGYIIFIIILGIFINFFADYFNNNQNNESSKEISNIDETNSNHSSKAATINFDESQKFYVNKTNSYISLVLLILILLGTMFLKNPSEDEFKKFLYSPKRIQKESEEYIKSLDRLEAIKLLSNILLNSNNMSGNLIISRTDYVFFSIYDVKTENDEPIYIPTISNKYVGIWGSFFSTDSNRNNITFNNVSDFETVSERDSPSSNNDTQNQNENILPEYYDGSFKQHTTRTEDNLTEVIEKDKPTYSATTCHGVVINPMMKIKCYYCNDPDDSDFSNDEESNHKKIGDEISLIGNIYVNNKTNQTAICQYRDYCYSGGKMINDNSAENYKLLNCSLKKLPSEPSKLDYVDKYIAILDPVKNSPNDLKFSSITDNLAALGMDLMSADNATLWYLRRPYSNCAMLVRDAMNGDEGAINNLLNSEKCGSYD